MGAVQSKSLLTVLPCLSQDGSPIVCHCLGISEAQIRRAIQARQIRDLEELIQATQAGTGCTACRSRLAALLQTPRQAS